VPRLNLETRGAGVTSVREKSSPLNSNGSLFALARAYANLRNSALPGARWLCRSLHKPDVQFALALR
jgi:hypothetical protein